MFMEDLTDFIKYIKSFIPEDDVEKVKTILKIYNENMMLSENFDELELKFKDLEEKVTSTLSMLRRRFI